MGLSFCVSFFLSLSNDTHNRRRKVTAVDGSRLRFLLLLLLSRFLEFVLVEYIRRVLPPRRRRLHEGEKGGKGGRERRGYVRTKVWENRV